MSEMDFFKGVFEDRLSKVVGISVATIFGALTSFMMVGILWYERFGCISTINKIGIFIPK